MTKQIESRLEKILAMKKKGNNNQYVKALDLTIKIGELGEQKKLRDEAIVALKAIIQHGLVESMAWSCLSDLVSSKDKELEVLFEQNLRGEESCTACVNALLKMRGKKFYPEAVDVICDSKLSGETRFGVLELLSEHSRIPFDGMVHPHLTAAEVTDKDLPLAELRQWRDSGCGKFVEPKVEIPTAALKKAKVTLPKDYVQFLQKHRGRTALEYDGSEWQLFTATQLVETTNVNGQSLPQVRMLTGLVAGMQHAFDDDRTVDGKEKPYPLKRLSAGIAVGTSDAGDVLYLDPADKHSVWIFHCDGGDVEIVGKSFAAWKKKTRMA